MRVLVFQHIAIEHPGVFCDFMRAEGVRWDAVELDEGEPIPALEGYQALIVMGGPMDVWQESEHPWLVAEKAAIREAVSHHRIPYLGICLGHQLLATALGGEVGPIPGSEVGVLEIELTPEAEQDPLFSGLPRRGRSLQWHSAEVKRLPPDSVVLARSPICPIQAFRAGAQAYGIQYHTEVTRDTVPEWGCVPAYANALESTLGEGALESFEREVASSLPQFNASARTLYDNFMRIVRARDQGGDDRRRAVSG
jgi:GMP synthase-like glutamine amidotransferase